MKRALGLISWIGVFLLVGTPSPVHGQALLDLLDELVRDHPQIQAADKAVATAREEVAKAAAGFLPTVNFANDYGHEFIDNPGERDAGDGKISSRTRQTSTLTVTQNIFQGFNTTSQARSALLNKLVRESELITTRQNVLFEAISTYIDVLRQAELLELASDNEETIQIQLNLEDERVQKGTGIAVDVLEAKKRLQLAKERRIRFEGNLEDAFSRFQQVFNRDPDLETLTDPMPSADLVPQSIDEAIDIALIENPNVLNSDRQLAVARENKKTARADLFPTVDLVGTANYERHNGGTIGTRRDATVLLSANWDLFTGFTTRANVAQAAFDFAASRDNYEFAIRKAIEAVRLAWKGLETRRKQVAQLENAVNISSEVFESRKKLRASGRETVINVLDAESEITNTRINFTSALFDERVAVYSLLQAMGRLSLLDIESSAEGAGDTLPR